MFARAALSSKNVVKSAPLTRRMASVTDFKHPTMADLPVPNGSWSEAYSKKQTKYNLTLLFGIAFTAGTAAYANTSGLVDLGLGPKIGE